MFEVKELSRLHQDYLASFLRSQITTMQNVLDSVENSEEYDDAYLAESMKRVERDIRRFRRIYNN